MAAVARVAVAVCGSVGASEARQALCVLSQSKVPGALQSHAQVDSRYLPLALATRTPCGHAVGSR